ncbi:MAG TPA: mycofactocin biosynthesis chaperone MftB [Baekduia sp.]|jgi:putative mycofactocin binding protein MftB
MSTTTVSPDRATTFDLDGSWRLHPQVALRPESFGALAYHFGTRRLSFLKDRTLLSIVEHLGAEPCAADACAAAGVAPADLPRYEQALATLAATDMICPGAPA